MPRDPQIEAIFTTADDQMQGLWGLHRYLKAATDVTSQENLIPCLPQGAFPVTHCWSRQYDPRELVKAMRDTGIDFLISRSSVVSLVTICETALDRFNIRLANLHKCDKKAGNKKLLSWAFELVKCSSRGSPEMISRLPETCGDLDNARRLRNCIVHNNGGYNVMYRSDAIKDGWVKTQFERDSGSDLVASREKIFLLTERFEHFNQSHIEFLHVLHNTIQFSFFGHGGGYNYAEESKRIEWYRILSGRRIVEM